MKQGETWDVIRSMFTSVYAVADFITVVLVPIAAVVLFQSAGRVTWIQRWVLRAPIRGAVREMRAEPAHPRSETRRSATALRAHIDAVLIETTTPPARILDGVRENGIAAAATSMTTLHRLSELAASPGRQSPLARLWPEQAHVVTRTLTAVHAHVTGMLDLQQTDAPLVSRLGALVSAYTGGVVLIDGADTRSGVLDSVRIWHTGRWSGPDSPHERGPGAPDERDEWSRRHVGHITTRLTGGASSPPLRIGDYDGRVLDLTAVRLRIDRTHQSPVAVLETSETCYLTTEASPDFAGKHLPQVLDDGDPRTRVYRRAIADDGGAGGDSRDDGFVASNDSRIAILATALTLISHAAVVPELVLAKRSGRARNAVDVLSTTTGGVFELPRGEDAGDLDDMGDPDPLTSVLREASEELGFSPQRDDVVAAAVLHSNVLGRGGPAEGQLGATVLYLAHTAKSVGDIERTRAIHADWTAGRYELAGLVTVPLPPPATLSPRAVGDAAARFVTHLHELAPEIDQIATISALYAAANQYGTTHVVGALSRLDEPWWALPWSGAAGVRLVRDPARIAPHHHRQSQEVSPAAWQKARTDLGLERAD